MQSSHKGEGGPAFLEEVLPRVRRYFDWLDRVRDPDRDGLIATLQPDESGLDHTPKYDRYLGIERVEHAEFTAAWERVTAPYTAVARDPAAMFAAASFIVEDVLVNTIYAENQRVLGELLETSGARAGTAEMRSRARKTTAALVEKCYEPGAGLFFDLAGREEKPLGVNTVSCLMRLALPDLPAPLAESLVGHISDPREYQTPFPVPSVALNEPSYARATEGNRLLWRGPSWINTNWYLARGLRRHGRADLAEAPSAASATCGVLRRGRDLASAGG